MAINHDRSNLEQHLIWYEPVQEKKIKKNYARISANTNGSDHLAQESRLIWPLSGRIWLFINLISVLIPIWHYLLETWQNCHKKVCYQKLRNDFKDRNQRWSGSERLSSYTVSWKLYLYCTCPTFKTIFSRNPKCPSY